MTDLIFKELSYKITGLVYEVNDTIGFGQPEKIYADAFAILLDRERIPYKREVYSPIIINNKVIKKYFIDYIIDNSIVVEFKVSDKDYKQVCSQLFRYLKASKHKLGIIYRFSKSGVRVKRIPNLY